jgi:long-chain acyl-CoA synthetase
MTGQTFHNSYEIGGQTATEGKIRRSYIVNKGDALPSSPHPTVKTLYDILLYCSREFPADKKFLGHRRLLRVVKETKEVTKMVGGVEQTETKTWSFNELSPYRWETYLDVHTKAVQIGAGLSFLGMAPKDRLTIFHSTSPEWFIMAQACYSQSITITTAYDNLGDDALIYSLNEGEITTLFTQTDLLKVVTKIGDRAPTLRNVIYSGEMTAAELQRIKDLCPQFQFYPMAQVQELGRLNPVPAVAPEPEDICCIMYTSGSTGNPKGVMLSHANVVAAVAGAVSGVFQYVSNDGCYLAYLPLAHVLEFTVEHSCMFQGIPMGYGSPRTLTDTSVRNCKGDLGELQPSFMAGVPSVWETIRKAIVAKLEQASPMEKYVFKKAYNLKKQLMRSGLPTTYVDQTIFKKIQAITGGKLVFALSGGAPIAYETQEFLSVTLCQIIQGYGMTESCGTLCVQPIREKSVYGLVGAPFPSVELKLVAAMGYEPNPTDPSIPPRGEIWARGKNIMKGYFKQPELTAEAMQDGWLMTGDIGEWRPDGSLAIIDRKKNLVKLSHGEYVAIEKMEAQYKTSKYVNNLCIHADPVKSHVVALILANELEIQKLAKSLGVDEEDYSNKDLIAAVVKDLAVAASHAEFKGAEILKVITLVKGEWTPDNEMLTAAQKLNRKAVLAKYETDLIKMYQ